MKYVLMQEGAFRGLFDMLWGAMVAADKIYGRRVAWYYWPAHRAWEGDVAGEIWIEAVDPV